MTTRHTITHADEMYRGNAFLDGYSPDGRRGTLMSNLHYHKFLSTAGAAAVAADADGFYTSNGSASTLYGCGSDGSATGNWVSLCSGALCSTKPGSAFLTMDVPRNVCVAPCAADTVTVKIHGRDQYGQYMAESIKCSGGGGNGTCGVRCFKYIDKMYSSAHFTSSIRIGTGNRLGLPFHLQDKGQIIAVTVNGSVHTSYTLHLGASYATTINTNVGSADVYGDIKFSSNSVPDGTRILGVLMEVDSTTKRKAFGPPQVSSCTGGVT